MTPLRQRNKRLEETDMIGIAWSPQRSQLLHFPGLMGNNSANKLRIIPPFKTTPQYGIEGETTSR